MDIRTWRRLAAGAVGAVAITSALASTAAGAAAATTSPPTGRHVLLISVDGLHASDLSQYVAAHPTSTLAELSGRGTTYTDASTSEPSDSFPGLLAEVTGGTPKSTGVYYDNSYDRSLYPPPGTLAAGTAPCTGSPGTETEYAENIDTNQAHKSLFESIDPAQLPRQIINGGCVPVYPNTFLRTNTIFSVAHDAGLRTAWADKHPAYQIVNGFNTPGAVDDLYTPEINADTPITPATVANRPGATVTIPFPSFGLTDRVENTEAYDQIKVNAVLNQVDGYSADRSQSPGSPAIFGMNFQAVSVAQKLVDPVKSCDRSNNAPGCDPSYVPGGYLPGNLSFTPQMTSALAFVDSALGSMVRELQAQGLASSTEVIITAKHGQSPIDPAKLTKVGHAVTTVLKGANVPVAQNTDDDVALVWLRDQAHNQQAAGALQADKAGPNTARVDYVLVGAPLISQFANPATDPRVPDLIVEPVAGTIYTTSKAKVAEHGGFAEDDTHVALLVADPTPGGAAPSASSASSYTGPVTTTQVAPTILSFLGLNPNLLQAVRHESTKALPSASPSPMVPESPLTLALPLSALGLAALVIRRRRRGRWATTS